MYLNVWDFAIISAIYSQIVYKIKRNYETFDIYIEGMTCLVESFKNLGPNNTLSDQVQLGHFHWSKMDPIQIYVIFYQKKMKPTVRFNFWGGSYWFNTCSSFIGIFYF